MPSRKEAGPLLAFLSVMARQLIDIWQTEEKLQDMGGLVWRRWVEGVRPHLLDDPTPSNARVRITETPLANQVWIPETDVYVRFLVLDDVHVWLVAAVDLMADSGFPDEDHDGGWSGPIEDWD